MKITTKWLEEQQACMGGIDWFKNQKESDGIEVIKNLIKCDKLQWANWTIVRLFTHKMQIQYAVFAAEQAIENFEKVYPNDNRPRNAIEAAKNYLKNPSDENKLSAYSAAYSAANSADSAANSVDSARSARSAYSAADSAAYSAHSAANSVDSARSAADSAHSAANSADSAARSAMILKILKYGFELLKGGSDEKD